MSNTKTETRTEWAVLYRGEPLGVSIKDEADAADYIERGVAAGNDPADYAIGTREVTVTSTDWEAI